MFAKRLKKLRMDYQISQAKLASNLLVTRQNISDWENGKSECNFDMLKNIASFFEVSIDYLLGASDEEYLIIKI